VILSIYQLFIVGTNFPRKLEDIARHYRLYEEYMSYWKQLFSDNIITIQYEDLVSSQEPVIREVVEFCELPWEDACLDFYNSKSVVNTPSAMQVKQPLHRGAIDRWSLISPF
jgi:hypothetical protein